MIGDEVHTGSTNGHSLHPEPRAEGAELPLQAIFDGAPVNFIYCDANLTVTHVNRATTATDRGGGACGGSCCFRGRSRWDAEAQVPRARQRIWWRWPLRRREE